MNRRQIDEAEQEVEQMKQAYLRRFGWDLTCNTPGSYWLWRRDFATEDAASHRRWEERGPGPLGWPSQPRPYGVITASLDLAVSMTERFLDEHPDVAE
jgi:hypothetical protein